MSNFEFAATLAAFASLGGIVGALLRERDEFTPIIFVVIASAPLWLSPSWCSWTWSSIDAHRGAWTLLLGLVVGFWVAYRVLRKRGELV